MLRASASRTDGGFSLLEVMVATVVLAIVMTAVISSLSTLNLAHQANRDSAKVREIAQALSERIMGAAWGNLGRKQDIPGSNGWSWHRRATPIPANTTSTNLPMVEYPLSSLMDPGETTTDSRDLIKLGILAEPSGVRSLRVFVEYYSDRLVYNLEQRMAVPGKQLFQAWNEEMGDPRPQPVIKPLVGDTCMPEDHNVFDLGNVDRTIIVRILINWRPPYVLELKDAANQPILDADGRPLGTSWYEVILARRK